MAISVRVPYFPFIALAYPDFTRHGESRRT